MTRTDDDRFRVELVGGHTVVARRVLAATGLVDELPDIEGLAEHWGGDVIHCPFCHGFEVRDRRIVQIVTHPMGLHPAGLFRQLSARLTVVLHDGVDVDDPELEALRAAGVRRSSTTASGASSPATTGTSRRSSWSTATASTPTRSWSAPGSGCAPNRSRRSVSRPAAHPSGLGDFVETDATGATVGAGPLRRRQRDRSEPAGAAGRGRRQPGRRHDQLQPRPRRHRGRGPTVGQRGRLGSPLRRRPDLERQPQRHARQRDRRRSRPAGRSTSAPARAATRSGWPSRAGA